VGNSEKGPCTAGLRPQEGTVLMVVLGVPEAEGGEWNQLPQPG
jgi:hypothetical protein